VNSFTHFPAFSVDYIRGLKKLSPNPLIESVNALDVKDEGIPPPLQTLRHTTYVNPDRPNISQVRRKPVPRLSDLVSSPFVPENRRDVVRKGALSSYPTLNNGGFGQPCRVDLEELAVPREIRIHNLTLKKMLGVGGQGRVYLAQGSTMKREQMSEKKEHTQTVFAVKIMVKSHNAGYDDILQEQRLLRRLRGNILLLQLEASFHDQKNFYLITVRLWLFHLGIPLLTALQEYHSGGDLDSLLKLYGHFSVCAARIYTAELVS
jgi:hypothetical protein